MAYKNFESLKKAILAKAQKGMHEKVLPIVKTKMSGAIEDVVYKSYEPVEYVRRRDRGEKGGLDDVDNVIGKSTNITSNGFDYVIENITLPDTVGAPDVYLAPLIIMGQEKAIAYGYPLLYHDLAEYAPYGKPRDFITETIKRLGDGKMLSYILEDYMNDK
jgi:hypothetical protein